MVYIRYINNNKLPRGVRKLEFDASKNLSKLIKTVPNYDYDNCVEAIRMVIDIYKDLRKDLADEKLIINSEAERCSVEYLNDIIKKK